MANFDPAVDYVLVNESGKLLSDKKTGEYSKYGITQKTVMRCLAYSANEAKAFVDVMNVKNAIEFYRTYIWPHLFTSIRDQKVTTKLFDMVVNMGEPAAVILAQHACINLGLTVKPDGAFGTRTLTAVNTLQPARLLSEMVRLCEAFYADLVERHPEKYLTYADGWKERAQKLPL